MGANQSSKSRQQYAPEFGKTANTATMQTTSNSNSNSKNSFSRQQLNRLLRKSLPTHSARPNISVSATASNNNKCKLTITNGNNQKQANDDEFAREPSGQRQMGAQSQAMSGGHDSRVQPRRFVSDNNSKSSIGVGGTKFNNSTAEKYFVTGGPQVQRHERLANNNQTGEPSNGLSSKTTASAYDANREQSNWHTTTATTTTHNTPHKAITCRPLEQDQRLLLVRQQQQQHHYNNSIITNTTTQLPSQQQARQPLNSSSAYHQLNQHHRHHHQQLAEHQQSQQLLLQAPKQELEQQQHMNGDGIGVRIRPNKSNKPHQSQMQQQLKSSCSPSSASAASSSSVSAGSSAASSSESLKLQRRVDAKRPSQSAEQSSSARSKLNKSSQEQHDLYSHSHSHSISRERELQSVATQHNNHHHGRSRSIGEPLSWSRQHQLATGVNMNARPYQRQQMLLMANGTQQAQQQQYQQHHPSQDEHHMVNQQAQTAATAAASGPHEMMSPLHLYDHHQVPMTMNYTRGNADEIEQFYSRNLHLLTNNTYVPHAPQVTLVNLNHSNTIGHMSAPSQRRYKWPKQQYQYLNSSASGFPDSPGHNIHHHQNIVPHPTNDHLASLTRYDNEPYGGGFVSMIDTPVNFSNSNNNNNQSVSYYSEQDFLEGSFANSSMDPSTATIKSLGSKSLRKSPAARNKSRARNPLAGIFTTSTTIERDSVAHNKFGSNTVHRLSSSKSHQNLQSSISRSTSHSGASHSNAAMRNASSSSLKRIKSSPLTAQQTSYEAMRTIDMYLIRQIARSCMDFEMEQKIDLEIRLRELAAQSMLEAQTEIDVLEVEKSLLTSDQRMNCYANQLEQQRKRLSNPSLATTDSGRGSKTSRWADGGLLPNGKVSEAASQVASTRAPRSDVVGAPHDDTSSSPATFSLLSKSSQSSPSKLSPVSGQSTNSGVSQPQSPPSPLPPPTDSAGSSLTEQGPCTKTGLPNATSTTSRGSSLSRANNHVIRRPTSNSNTLSRRHRSQRQQHRERLAQLIASQYNITDSQLSPDTKTTITLSDLRVPLMWRDVDHFKGRGDYRRYAVFCLAKIGSQIYDTQLISDVDRQMTDLTFEDLIMFNNVELDFELEFEVYSCVYLEQFSLSSTPRKLMEKLSNSVGRAMGRRLATQTASVNYIRELEAYDKSYRFAMIASARLTLVDASDSTKTYDLQLMSPEAHGRHATALSSSQQHQTNSGLHQSTTSGIAQTQSGMTHIINGRHYQSPGNHNGIVTASNQRDLHKNTLPLFGHFCCRLHVQPNVFNDKHATSGYL